MLTIVRLLLCLSRIAIQHPTRKIYMRYDLTPSIEITGGPWYSGNELDMELIELLQALAKKYIKQKVLRFPQSASLRPWNVSPRSMRPFGKRKDELTEADRGMRLHPSRYIHCSWR